jgi:hypothetical protein
MYRHFPLIVALMVFRPNATAIAETFFVDSNRTAFTYYSSPFLSEHPCRDGCEFTVTGSFVASVASAFELESLELSVPPNNEVPFLQRELERTVPIAAELVDVLPESPISGLDVSDELFQFLLRPGKLVGFEQGELYLYGIRDFRPVDGDGFHLQLFAWSSSVLDCDNNGSIDAGDFSCLSDRNQVNTASQFVPEPSSLLLASTVLLVLWSRRRTTSTTEVSSC